MSEDFLKTGEGRIFFQETPLEEYDLVQCGGLSDWNRTRGAINPIRQQSLTTIGQQDIVGYTRAMRDMPAFTIQSRLREVSNFLISINCEAAVQNVWKDCGDPTNFHNFKYGLAWWKCPPEDLTGEALSVIEGDSVPIGLSNPFRAVYGPALMHYTIQFLSRRAIAETGKIADIVLFDEECQEDCLLKAKAGQYGYAVAEGQAGSPVDTSAVWYTEDESDNWAQCSEQPFLGAEGISCVVKMGTILDHRVIVSRGTTDAANPAEIAYADCSVIGQTDWVYSDVGVVDGEYITYMAWPNGRNLFAITNLGRIYRSRDSGATWEVVYTHSAVVRLNDISFTKRGIGWVVGNGDLLLHTEDYGDTWDEVDGPNDGLLNLTTVAVSPSGYVVLGDSAGVAHATVTEAQTTWVTRELQGITATNVRRIRCVNDLAWWAIADIAATPPSNGNSRVLRSYDGAASFRLRELSHNIYPNDGLYALAVVPGDCNRVVVGGAPYGGTAFLTRTNTTIDRFVG